MADLIERAAAHKMMVHLKRYVWTSPVSTERRVTVDSDDVNFGLDKLPTVDAEPVKHGRWKFDAVEMEYFCSECGQNAPIGLSSYILHNYCPNCGAKMDVTDINVGNKTEVRKE